MLELDCLYCYEMYFYLCIFTGTHRLTEAMNLTHSSRFATQ